MKKLPEVEYSHESLYRMLTAQISSKLLLAGIELAIFNYLSKPISADSVAKELKWDPVNTGLFLNALTTIDLVMKKNGLYKNTPVAQTFLVKGSETYLGEEFSATAKMWHHALENIPKLVKEHHLPSLKTDTNSEKLWEQFAVSMANDERAGTAQQLTKIITSFPEFPYFKKMLDLGGGPGLMGIAIVEAHPTMKGIVFDQPAVVRITEQFIKEYEISDRMSVIEGNYLQDSIGNNYDLILASATLNSAKENLDNLMKKIYNALNPGGLFISFAEGLTHEGTRPDVRVLESIATSLTSKTRYFEQGFIADSMLRVGFKSVRSSTLSTNWGPMDLDIGRKQF